MTAYSQLTTSNQRGEQHMKETWAQDIMRKFGSKTDDEDLKNGYKKICEPNFGDIVFFKNKEGAFQKIKIVRGQYFSNGRLSNFWYWVDVNEDGSESKEECSGYGNFFIKPNQ